MLSQLASQLTLKKLSKKTFFYHKACSDAMNQDLELFGELVGCTDDLDALDEE